MRGGYYVFQGAVGIMYFRSWIPSKSADDNLFECVKFFGCVKYFGRVKYFGQSCSRLGPGSRGAVPWLPLELPPVL